MFKSRLLTSLALGLLLCLTLLGEGLYGAAVFTLMIALMAYIAVQEFLALTAGFGYAGFPRLAGGCAIFLTLATGIGPALISGGSPITDALEALVLGIFLVLGFRQVFRHHEREKALLQFFVSLTGLMYICWTLDFIPKLYFADGFDAGGRWLVFFLLVVTKAADIGAYAIGTATARRPAGNHKMVPSISPKKSWEGFFGGMVTSMAVAVLMIYFFKDKFTLNQGPFLNYGWALFWGFFASVLGFWGDLAESALKRAAKAKDSGRLPGLGGVLDVVDSLILVAPFFYAFVRFMTLKA